MDFHRPVCVPLSQQQHRHGSPFDVGTKGAGGIHEPWARERGHSRKRQNGYSCH